LIKILIVNFHYDLIISSTDRAEVLQTKERYMNIFYI